MALVHTPRDSLGTACPGFSLPAVDGKTYSLSDFPPAKALLVMFICNHCPYVVAIEDRLISLGKEYLDKNINIVAICSNDSVSYPEDSFELLQKRWNEKEYSFPYLHDETQKIAKEFGAVCTPDFFLYDKDLKLSYRGRLDDSWKDASQVTKREMRMAIDTLLSGDTVDLEQVPSMGCSIKWV